MKEEVRLPIKKATALVLLQINAEVSAVQAQLQTVTQRLHDTLRTIYTENGIQSAPKRSSETARKS